MDEVEEVLRTGEPRMTENLTVPLVAEFDATPEQVWTAWAGPRTLDRSYGPPSWPAAFTRHDVVVVVVGGGGGGGGESRCHVTGPDGDTRSDCWQMQTLDKPDRIDFTNGLAGHDGEPMTEMPPMSGRVTFEATGPRTRTTLVPRFVDLAQVELMLRMVTVEGMAEGIVRIDGILAMALLWANETTKGKWYDRCHE